MRTLKSVPIAMTGQLADWLAREAKSAGASRSAYVRRLIERERDSGICERVAKIEEKLKALCKPKP